MDNVSREMEILRKSQKEMLQIKNTITKMENGCNELIGILEKAGERISEIGDIKIVTSKTKN